VLCIEDSLRTRGYRVQVEQGRRARRWVRSVPAGPPTIRVLCVADIDPVYAQRLCHGRPDFHIVAVTTPLAVVEEIEELVGRHRSLRSPRPSRMILPQPTLIEQSLHSGRRFGQGLVTAVGAVALVAVGGMFGAWIRVLEVDAAARPVEPTVVRVQADETVAPRERAPRSRPDEPVLSAVAPLGKTEAGREFSSLPGAAGQDRGRARRSRASESGLGIIDAQPAGTSIVPSR
jgi:hypothetical protein